MLKYILVFIFTISLIINKLDAQSWRFPDCMDLEVSEINFINNDTLLVTVYNQCNSCIQHQYTSLTAYLNEDTIAVEDMIASKPSPANNDEYTYTLLIKKPLQIINGLWFEMLFICDSLKHADNLVVNIPPNIILQEDRITITRDFNCNQISIDGDFTNYDIHIADEFNNIITNFTGASSPIKINTAVFDNQLHYLTIQHQQLEKVRLHKLFSPCNANVELTEISLEEAQANQFISFTIEERDILITEFKENAWPFHGKIVDTDSIEFDVNQQYPLSRAIYAFVPDDQVAPGHVETIGLEFNQVFSLNNLNMDLTKLTSNEQFRDEFIQTGSQNPMLAKFGFHQTYLIGYGQPIQITKVESVINHPDKIFVSGTFSGITEPYNVAEIFNGQFKVLIEN